VQAVVVASAVALVAAACGGSSSGGGGGNKPKAAANVFNAGVTGVRNVSDKTGGTLNLIADSDCDYYDPARTYYGHCWDMQRLFSRSLMGYKAEPGTAGLDVVPDLAAEAGTTSDGGKTWTYKIRSGLKYEDGTAITSKDVKYAIERVFAQSVINGGPTYYITYLCPTAINASGGCDSYKGPYKDKDPNHLGLSTIKTPDDTSIEFDLNQKVGDWNYIMALPGSTPVPIAYDQSAKGGAKYTFHPMSSGPYKFETYSPGKSLTLVRNTNWDKASDPFRKALVDKVVFTIDTNDEDVDNRLINNIADVDINGVGVQVATQSKILTNPTLKARADNPVTGATRYLAIDQNVKPFDNLQCRIAVQYGVNKVDCQTARGGPIGGGDIATTMLNPDVKGYTKFDLYPDNNGQGDVAKAKDALSKCGQPNGFTTHLATTNTSKGKAMAAAVQNSLKRVGINVVIDEGDAATYYSQFIGAPAVNKSKDRALMIAGWGADWPTGYGFFSSIIDGRKILPQGNSNYSETNDPKINQMIDQAAGESDADAAAKIWGDVDKQLMQGATLVPMTYDKALVINSTNVTNAFILASMLGIYDFQAMGHV
jgi:peptide/nickel transport system substrate-binding protein